MIQKTSLVSQKKSCEYQIIHNYTLGARYPVYPINKASCKRGKVILKDSTYVHPHIRHLNIVNEVTTQTTTTVQTRPGK